MGWGFEGGDYTQRSLSGAVGQVGAVLSAPVSQPPPQMPTKPPPPQSLSSGSLRSLYSQTSEPRHRMMESSRLGLLALPSPYAPPALETSSSAAPTRRGHQAWALQTQLAKSLLPHWQAGFLSLAGGQGGWRKATGD